LFRIARVLFVPWFGVSAWAGSMVLTSPIDYQVAQRNSVEGGSVPVTGTLAEGVPGDGILEVRVTRGGIAGSDGDGWRALPFEKSGNAFKAGLRLPSGGWYRLEIRIRAGNVEAGGAVVEHLGMGEVFVVAGQSNSANHGEEKQRTSTGLASTFDGARWRPADDPQPGASGGGGSFLPPFGDAMAERLGVPIGFLACGIGATSVREWLPAGATFPNPPTIERRVRALPDGQWESLGEAYSAFLVRLRQPGVRGFRAVLWHQGESDANQRDSSRTLSGALYRASLERVIRDSRAAVGWEVPWFVAQVSYHVPGDEASADIRAAQASLWKDGIALEGPDSDALTGLLRERGGQGVHFSGPGLREHAARWVDKVAPWLEGRLRVP